MEAKKIKLITFAPHPNFGTCLQSYALNRVLQNLGHEVEFIYNRRENPPVSLFSRLRRILASKAKKVLPKSIVAFIDPRSTSSQKKESEGDPFILSLPDHKFLYLLSLLPFYRKIYNLLKYRTLQQKKVCRFAFKNGNFNMRRIYTHKQYRQLLDDTDIFITGSDQIWNPYCGGFNPMMFVEFGGDRKRIAYASSISQPKFPDIVRERAKNDLMKFQHIGVREQSSVELLNDLLGRTDVRLVVDPTYLLSVEEWGEFAMKAEVEFEIPEKYIFCYFVGSARADIYEQMAQDAKAFTKIENVIILDCNNCQIRYGNGKVYGDAGPHEWVCLLEHSSYVCTDSFHATVFALKFKKDFVHALKNAEDELGSQNTRMFDILNRYSLSNKIYTQGNTLWRIPVDYAKVTPMIDDEIKDCMEFLKYEIEN